MIGTHELGDHVRVPKVGAERADDCLLDPVEIKGSGIGTRPPVSASRVQRPASTSPSFSRKWRCLRLKRTYTPKLFAGGEQAQQLFATLSRDLESIIKDN